MVLEHIAIWTEDLERLKAYYIRYFDGKANDKYINAANRFESYFITFESGARLEIMTKPNLPENENDTIVKQHKGIIHFAFGVKTKTEVDFKATQLKDAGFVILRGPRITGDGYYEFETLDPDNNRIEVTTKATDVLANNATSL